MTLGASVEKFSPTMGASILHWNSIHIRADLNIGLTHLKHGGWMHPSIPRSIMKHNTCIQIYEKHMCYPKII